MVKDAAHSIRYTSTPGPPFEFVTVKRPGPELAQQAKAAAIPEGVRPRVLIYTVHDGANIPRWFLDAPPIRKMAEDGSLWRTYVQERDWGADMVAQRTAELLGLDGYFRVTMARVVMDFNRFPGSSPPNCSPLDRLAIIEPFSQLLDHTHKRRILETVYDAISIGMERALQDKLIFVAIHTYDRFNASATPRPEISLLTRALSYQQNSHLPYNLFDPLFPDVLAESSANRILRDRLALTLQKSGLDVEHNYPYCLPDGSLEIRSQPWLFFREVRKRFLDEHPKTSQDASFDLVWSMLLNTNLRLVDGGILQGYLHRFRRAPAGREREFDQARMAYEQIARFIENNPHMVDEYRSWSGRTSALGVEVRKDLVWEFRDGDPVRPKDDAAHLIANKLAFGIAEYFRKDCEGPHCY